MYFDRVEELTHRMTKKFVYPLQELVIKAFVTSYKSNDSDDKKKERAIKFVEETQYNFSKNNHNGKRKDKWDLGQISILFNS